LNVISNEKGIKKINKTNEFNSSFEAVTRQTSIILESFQISNKSKDSFENLFLTNLDEIEILETEYSQQEDLKSSSSFILDHLSIFEENENQEEEPEDEEFLDHPDLKLFM
jgi:hypothetical protein